MPRPTPLNPVSPLLRLKGADARKRANDSIVDDDLKRKIGIAH